MSWLSLVVHSFTNVNCRCLGFGVHSAIRMVVGRSRIFFVRFSLVSANFVCVARSLFIRLLSVVRSSFKAVRKDNNLLTTF